MATLAQQIVNGLVLGALIGLIALGYTMVYGIIKLINFAHGEVFMAGAFGAHFTSVYLLPDGVSWYAALPVLCVAAVATSVTVAVLMERLAYRPLRDAHRLAPLITALGVSILLQEMVRVFYPGATAPLPFPGSSSTPNSSWDRRSCCGPGCWPWPFLRCWPRRSTCTWSVRGSAGPCGPLPRTRTPPA